VLKKPRKETHGKTERTIVSFVSIASTLCLDEVNHNCERRHGTMLSEQELAKIRAQMWKEASAIWDRFFLISSFVGLVVVSIALFVIYPQFQQVLDPKIIS
jgi:maltooligosyltrehalose synthase